jgi:hypothetical protein
MTAPAVVAAKFTVDGDDAVVRAVRELSAAMQQAKRTSTDVSNSVGGGFIRMGRSAADANMGFNKLSKGFENLAAASLGLTGTQSKLVEGLLLLGGGSAVVLGVAAGVAAMGLAYRLLTKDLREAREEADKFVKSMEAAANARLPERNRLEDQRAEAATNLATIERNLTENQQRILTEKSLLGVSPAEIINTFTKDVQEDIKRALDLRRQIAEIDRQLARGGRVSLDERAAEVQRLAALRAAGTETPADTQRITQLVTELRVERASLVENVHTQSRRLELDQQIATLTKTRTESTKRETVAVKEQAETLTALQQEAGRRLAANAKNAAKEFLDAIERAERGLSDIFTRTFPTGDTGEAVAQRIMAQSARSVPGSAVNITAEDLALVQVQADRLLATIEGLSLEVTNLGAEFKDAGRALFVDFFGSAITQGESLLDLLANIASAIQRIAAEALAAQIFGGVIGAAALPAAPTFLGSAAGIAPVGLNRGGMVPGGKGTRDTVPAMLTAGEGVLTVREITRLGGPAGFAQFRQSLGTTSLPPVRRHGRQHLNTGGMVVEGGHSSFDGEIIVRSEQGTSVTISKGEFLRHVAENPRALRSVVNRG